MTRELTLEVTVSDPYDGAVRLLCDAQRFGFRLIQFSLARAAEMDTAIVMTLEVPPETNAQQIAARFTRHGAVTALHPRF